MCDVLHVSTSKLPVKSYNLATDYDYVCTELDLENMTLGLGYPSRGQHIWKYQPNPNQYREVKART